jgi:hypothetical protein
MPSIQKKWGEVIGSYNTAAQIAQNSERQLEAIKTLEKSEKSKEELKEQIEQNAKGTNIFSKRRQSVTSTIKNSNYRTQV